MTLSTQCRLERAGALQVSFIPARFAEVGRTIRIKEDGVWQDGWRVDAVWGSLPAEVVEKNARNFKTHRRATDV